MILRNDVLYVLVIGIKGDFMYLDLLRVDP